MEKIFDNITLKLDDNLNDLRSIRNASYDLVIFDPPFGRDIDFLSERMNHSARILKEGGNLIILEKPNIIEEISFYIRYNQRYNSEHNVWKSMIQQEWISVEANCSLPMPQRLASATRVFYILRKGTGERKFYADDGMKANSGRIIMDPNSIITDIWTQKRFKAGTRITIDNKKLKISNSSPKWAIENILYTFARPGDKVYDAFGGSGTTPALCYEYGIECKSIEINPEHFEIMIEKTKRAQIKYKDKNKKIFTPMLVNLTKKAKKSKNIEDIMLKNLKISREIYESKNR